MMFAIGHGKMRRALDVSLSILFCGIVPADGQAVAASWREFVSSSGFQVSYPASWFRINDSSKVLDITSSSHRLEGVVISTGAQMITVYETTPISDDDYSQELQSTDPAEQVLGSSVRHMGTSLNGCSDVHIVESEDEIGPHTYYLEHHMYCKIRDRLFVLSLTGKMILRVKPLMRLLCVC
ncbi:MAG TPA: hypothetical protein VMP11_02700 [Verrucomicrobiae bacterium]|nr:hypothetical protein [Verrucomicrobiae bacterium]